MKRILLIILLLALSTPAFAVTQWNISIPATGDNLTSWPAAVTAQWSIMDALLSNYRMLMPIVYKNSTTATVNAGEIVVSNVSGSLRLFLQNGSNTDITTANLDTGSSFSASTTYYVYAGTSTNTDSAATFYISLSSSAPSGTTYYKRLGNFTTDSSGNIAGVFNDNSFGTGIKVSKSVNTPYLATTDGYVEGAGSQTSGGTGQINCYTDANVSPSTDVSHVIIPNAVGLDIPYSFKVRKGDYWQCTAGAHWSNDLLWFVPQGQ